MDNSSPPPRLAHTLKRCIERKEDAHTANFILSRWESIPRLKEPFSRMELEILRRPSGFHMRYIDAKYEEGDSEPHWCHRSEATVHDISGWLITYACEVSQELDKIVELEAPDPFLLADTIAAKAGHDVFIDYICSTAEGRSTVFRLARAEKSRKEILS